MQLNRTKILFILLSLLLGNPLFAARNIIGRYIQDLNSCREFTILDSSKDLSYTPTSYFWDFGDGSTSTAKDPVHTFYANKKFTITHIVKNGTDTDTGFSTITINCNLNLVASFNFQVDTSDYHKFKFTDATIGGPTYFHWDFGDGTKDSSTNNPNHTYVNDGTYTVTLTVKNAYDQKKISQTVVVKYLYYKCIGQYAGYYTIDTIDCKTLVFYNASTWFWKSYQWDFGDGTTSTVKEPLHTFPRSGYYTISLSAINGVCKDTMHRRIKVSCNNCEKMDADIELSIDTANLSNAILTNNSKGVIQSHYWNFGDNTTSSAAAPTHVYTSSGSILLTYIGTDTNNCSDTAYLGFTIDSLGHIKRGALSFTLQIIDKTTNATTGIANIPHKQTNLIVYPNPAHADFKIVNSGVQNEILQLIDIMGALIRTIEVPAKSEVSVSTEQWAKGLYLLCNITGTHFKLLIE